MHERTTWHISNGGGLWVAKRSNSIVVLPRLIINRFENRRYSYAQRYAQAQTTGTK
jgi:hypothetical protein